MARGVALESGRGGVLPSGRGTTCPDACCRPQVCAFVYRAESCIPVLPPVAGCGFSRPPDIFICTDTLCDGGTDLIQPGDTVVVNGQCYGVIAGEIPRADADGFVYDLPSVECVTDCNAPGCIPVSPFSLAEPCNPACPPIYFCRSQFSSCRVIRVRFGGVDPPTGPGCCYRFDPALPPATPPGNVVVCNPIVSQGGVNVGSNCRLLDFGGLMTQTLGTTSCCECGDRADLVPGDCDYFQIVAGGGVVGGVPMCDPPPLSKVCCPGTTASTRILVDTYVRTTFPPGSFSGGPTGFGNWSSQTGTLAPSAGGGCNPGETRFAGTLTQTSISGPLVNGVPSGVPSVTTGPGVGCFCPLTMTQIQLPPGDCQDDDPETTCECLESFYDGLTIRNHWRLTLISDSGNGPQVQQITEAFVNIRVTNPGTVPTGCLGGCVGRTASAQAPRETLSFGVRGIVNVEDWL